MRVTNEPALFAVDTSLCFGYRPSAGTYSTVRDAGLDIFRAAGIGPIIAWVDDHLFFRLPQDTITNYNKMREAKARVIAEQGGRLKDNGHWWFKGEALANDTHEEFAEDCAHMVRDLTSKHPNDIAASHAYDFSHINQISDGLGILWEHWTGDTGTGCPHSVGSSRRHDTDGRRQGRCVMMTNYAQMD